MQKKTLFFIILICCFVLNCFAQQDSINQIKKFRLLAFGASVGYSFEKTSFLTLGGGAFYMGGLLAAEVGYNYKISFNPQINGHEICFDLGIGLPPYRWSSAFYLMLGANYNTVMDENQIDYQYIRPEVGLLIPGGIVLKKRNARGNLNHIAFTIKASYGYNVFLNNKTFLDLGNHTFSVGVMVGYGMNL